MWLAMVRERSQGCNDASIRFECAYIVVTVPTCCGLSQTPHAALFRTPVHLTDPFPLKAVVSLRDRRQGCENEDSGGVESMLEL